MFLSLRFLLVEFLFQQTNKRNNFCLGYPGLPNWPIPSWHVNCGIFFVTYEHRGSFGVKLTFNGPILQSEKILSGLGERNVRGAFVVLITFHPIFFYFHFHFQVRRR